MATMEDSETLIMVIGVAAGFGALALLCMICVCCCWCRASRAAAKKEKTITREPTPLDKLEFSKSMRMYAPRGRTLRTDLHNETMGSIGRLSRMREKLVRNGSMVPSVGSTLYNGKSNTSVVNGSVVSDNSALLRSKIPRPGNKRPPLEYVGTLPPETAIRTFPLRSSQLLAENILKQTKAATSRNSSSRVSTSTKTQAQKLQYQKQTKSNSKSTTSSNKENPPKITKMSNNKKHQKQNLASTGSETNEKPKMLEEAVRQKVIQHQRFMNPTYNSQRFQKETIESTIVNERSRVGPHSTILSVSDGDVALQIPNGDATVNDLTSTTVSRTTAFAVHVENEKRIVPTSHTAAKSDVFPDKNVTIREETLRMTQPELKTQKRVTISETATEIDVSPKLTTQREHDNHNATETPQLYDHYLASEVESQENTHTAYSSASSVTQIQSPTFGYVDLNSISDNTYEEVTVTNESISGESIDEALSIKDDTVEDRTVEEDTNEINTNADTTNNDNTIEDNTVEDNTNVSNPAKYDTYEDNTTENDTYEHNTNENNTDEDNTYNDDIYEDSGEQREEYPQQNDDFSIVENTDKNTISKIISERERDEDMKKQSDSDSDASYDDDDDSSTMSETHGKYDFQSVEEYNHINTTIKDDPPASDDEEYIITNKPIMIEEQVDVVKTDDLEITDIDTLIQNSRSNSPNQRPSSWHEDLNNVPVTEDDIKNANAHASVKREHSLKSTNSDTLSFTKEAEHVLEIAKSSLERKAKLKSVKQTAEDEGLVEVQVTKVNAAVVQEDPIDNEPETPKMQIITTHGSTTMPFTNTY